MSLVFAATCFEDGLAYDFVIVVEIGFGRFDLGWLFAGGGGKRACGFFIIGAEFDFGRCWVWLCGGGGLVSCDHERACIVFNFLRMAVGTFFML